MHKRDEVELISEGNVKGGEDIFVPPPPAPPPPPPPPPLPGLLGGFSIIGVKEKTVKRVVNSDPRVKEILQGADSDEIREGFLAYEQELSTSLRQINSEITAHESLENSAAKKAEDIDMALLAIPTKITDFEGKIALLKTMKGIGGKEKEEAEKRFKKGICDLEKEVISKGVTKRQLLQEVEAQKLQIFTLNEERFKVKKLQKDLTASKEQAVQDGVVAFKKGIKISIPKTKSGRSAWEDELCQHNTRFVNIRVKTDREVFYSKEDVLMLQLKMFDEEDWGHDDEATLESKLRNAIIVGRNDVKGLGATPRLSLKTILGYDVIDAYNEKERLKRDEADRARKEAKAKQEAELQKQALLKDPATPIRDSKPTAEISSPRTPVVGTPTTFSGWTPERSKQIIEEIKKRKAVEEALALEKQKRIEEERKRMQEEQMRVAAEQKRIAEERKREEAEHKKLQEEQRRAEAERQKRLEELKRIEEEQGRAAAEKALEAKHREAEELKRKHDAEILKRQEAEEQRRLAEERERKSREDAERVRQQQAASLQARQSSGAGSGGGGYRSPVNAAKLKGSSLSGLF